ncbi:MAG: hypothetical protein M3Q06_10995 [Bacteroidota bacterium]|nr:hypothetical protein [Bacteroidota bacterium]
MGIDPKRFSLFDLFYRNVSIYLFQVSVMIKRCLPLIVLIFVGCSKKDKEPRSTAKQISSVIFKRVDNASLSTDIVGDVSSDSVRIEFPSNIPINSLIPTIDFRGKKIDPADRTAQDFTNGISYVVTAEDGSTKRYSFRVSRTPSDTATLILGTWKLIKDSVTNNNYSNPVGGYLLPGVYTGTSLDFWKFEPNGVFSVRENNITGTGAYALTPNKKLDIPVWTAQYGLGTIETISNAAFTVSFSATSANGGQYFRKVYLKR